MSLYLAFSEHQCIYHHLQREWQRAVYSNIISIQIVIRITIVTVLLQRSPRHSPLPLISIHSSLESIGTIPDLISSAILPNGTVRDSSLGSLRPTHRICIPRKVKTYLSPPGKVTPIPAPALSSYLPTAAAIGTSLHLEPNSNPQSPIPRRMHLLPQPMQHTYSRSNHSATGR